MNRRQAIKQSFCYSASYLLSKGLLQADEPANPSATSPSENTHHFLMIGDWGWDDDLRPQTAVANGMKRYLSTQPFSCEALFLLGDNFYGSFKGGTSCPRWKTQFEDMYPKKSFPGPCHAMLGNHDYDDEPIEKLAAELAYAKDHPDTRRSLPSKWYRLELGPAEKPLATVLVIDTNYQNDVVSLTPQEKEAQLAWLKTELAKPRKSTWLIVMGHHPLYSNGAHGDDDTLIADLDPLFRQHKVHFYFCGHDHDLQHLEFENHPTSFIISGGGGAKIRATKQNRGPLSAAIYGFTHLAISHQQFSVNHLDANSKLLHSFSKKPRWHMENR